MKNQDLILDIDVFPLVIFFQSMCGITGIFRRSSWGVEDFQRLPSMTSLLEHRGPDDFGYLYLDSRDGRYQSGRENFEHRPCNVSLGNRRLAIIDLSPAGAQPIFNETGDVIAVFNGEIFNYLELREVLVARGHTFTSHTDSEVIVHAYEEWGEACVEKFNGMWAIAIWDQRKQQLFCSRDRFGIKPFYYYLDNNVFLFGSETKAILPALESRPTPNRRVIYDYLVNRSITHTEDTFFNEIKRLDPACNLVVTKSEERITRYWNYNSLSEQYSMQQPVDTFRDLFNDSIRLRLRSDVPVGIALSGGLDSTGLLACMADMGYSGKVKAFTAIFPGEVYNEQKYAEIAAKELGAELHCVEYDPGNFVEDVRKVTWYHDYPVILGQVVLRWLLMKQASKHVKVILEGQGADEMLAGYSGAYFMPFFKDELSRFHWVNAARMAVSRRGHIKWKVRGKLRSMLPGLGRPSSEVGHPELTDDFLNQPMGDLVSDTEELFPDRLTQTMYRHHSKEVLPALLKFGDAFSMASSLESRLPFLDHRLVEFIFQLPYQYKYDGRQTKVILRDALKDVMPKAIFARNDKVGFSTPVPSWIERSLENEIRPILLSDRCLERGILDGPCIERLLTREALQRNPNLAYRIFLWLSLELWFQQFIDG